MGFIYAIGAIILIIKLIMEAMEPEIPADYLKNQQALNRDGNLVRTGKLSKREYRRRMRDGYYR